MRVVAGQRSRAKVVEVDLEPGEVERRLTRK
jgi:hypothetical protein